MGNLSPIRPFRVRKNHMNPWMIKVTMISFLILTLKKNSNDNSKFKLKLFRHSKNWSRKTWAYKASQEDKDRNHQWKVLSASNNNNNCKKWRKKRNPSNKFQISINFSLLLALRQELQYSETLLLPFPKWTCNK